MVLTNALLTPAFRLFPLPYAPCVSRCPRSSIAYLAFRLYSLTYHQRKGSFLIFGHLHWPIEGSGMLGSFREVLYKKLHQLRRKVELFCFSYPVKLKAYLTGQLPLGYVSQKESGFFIAEND